MAKASDSVIGDLPVSLRQMVELLHVRHQSKLSRMRKLIFRTPIDPILCCRWSLCIYVAQRANITNHTGQPDILKELAVDRPGGIGQRVKVFCRISSLQLAYHAFAKGFAGSVDQMHHAL